MVLGYCCVEYRTCDNEDLAFSLHAPDAAGATHGSACNTVDHISLGEMKFFFTFNPAFSVG